jgi:ribonuclease P protein component
VDALLLEQGALKVVLGLRFRFNRIKTAGLSADSRLLRNIGYKHVLCAEKIADKQLNIFYSNNTFENSRLGIIASKKNFSRAVDRNKIKRVIREAFRQHAIKTRGLDLVVLVKNAYSVDNKVNNSKLGILFGQIENKCADL